MDDDHTTGRAHAGSIDCTVGDRGFALRRPASTGSAELSSRMSVDPPSVSRGCLRDGVGAAVVPMLWCGSLTPSADLPLEMLLRMNPDRDLLAMGFGGDDVGCGC